MRQLNLLIKHCSECPYFRFTEDNDYMYPLCYFREDVPFALIDLTDNWQRGQDPRCELPEYFDIDYNDTADNAEEIDYQPDEDSVFLSTNTLMASLNSLPDDWFNGMTDDEREDFNRKEDERIERIMAEELGYDVPSSQGVEFDEFDDDRE